MVRSDRYAIKVCVSVCDLCNNEEAPPGSERRRSPEAQEQSYRFQAGRPQANGLPSLSPFPSWKCEGTETGLQGCYRDRKKGQPRANPSEASKSFSGPCQPHGHMLTRAGPGHPCGPTGTLKPTLTRGSMAFPAAHPAPMPPSSKGDVAPADRRPSPSRAQSGCSMTFLSHQSTRCRPVLIPKRSHLQFPTRPSTSSELLREPPGRRYLHREGLWVSVLLGVLGQVHTPLGLGFSSSHVV